MPLAIFDLDNTLLAGDSDYGWGRFLVEQGVVDGEIYERENQRFYEDYQAGRLDILEYLTFSLEPLRRLEPATLTRLRERFLDEVVRPMITRASRQLLDRHRQRGDILLIITATNDFITAPIARELGVEHLIATLAEQREGRYTGHVAGTPCFQEGKVERLLAWLRQTGNNLAGSTFYSDSHNDLPLLELVTQPVAVDPDPTLADHAAALDWPEISLRGEAIRWIRGDWGPD
ncbi:MAG TPA: HAD family hydrolase [Chromatiales bacterium]|nr:HAD family hydrolase [Chromatiales bacterium]